MLFILGLSAAVHPVSVNLASVVDLLFLAVVTVLGAIMFYTGRRLNRLEGLIMLGLYAGSVYFVINR